MKSSADDRLGAKAGDVEVTGPTVTVFTKRNGVLSKTIGLAPDGAPRSDASECRMSAGTATRAQLKTASELADLIGSLASCRAVALGHLRGVVRDGTLVVTKAALQNHPGAIARTRKYIEYRAGCPGWALIDYDPKETPHAVEELIKEAGGIVPFLHRAVPALADAAHVVRASTSAGLYNVETGEDIRGSDGQHIYVGVKDSSDIPRFIDNLHDRMWLHGAGYHVIGKAGQLLERSAIDRSVSAPERLVFEGPPIVRHPLAQREEKRRPVPHEGEMLDTLQAFPPLDAAEQARLEQLRRESARRFDKEAQAARRRHVEHRAEELVLKHGISPQTARRHVSSLFQQTLSSYHELEFDDLGTVTVGEVLDKPEDYVGLTLADPVEGTAYGRCKAMVMRGADGLLFINSFAHGGMKYRLRYVLPHAEAALERAQEMEDAVEIAAASDLEADEKERLVKRIARKFDVSQPAVKKRLKDDAERRKNAYRTADGRDGGDSRVQRVCPPSNGALTNVVVELDGNLANDPSPAPAMRAVNGRLVEVRTTQAEGLHAVAVEAATEGGPIAEPTIVPLSRTGIQMLIEKHVAFRSTGRTGKYEASLPYPFIDALNELQDSRIPVVRAINTAPLVAQDGRLLAGEGLDRGTGIFHCIDPALRAILPATTPTDGEVKEAVRFLCEEWLVDVAADVGGKLTILLLAVTLIERVLCGARPAFFVTAGLAKAGKTTVAQMCATAVLGHSAPGVNWSDHPEERRKALFSFLRQGLRMVLWDNIQRGAEISCPAIERSLTEERMTDRVLGVSCAETVSTHTVQVFTGNRTTPKGDMCSRCLTISLDAGRPDPEARDFRHPDPLGWTRTHRFEILAALYKILVAGVRCRPADIAAKTRFKTWWKLVGWPVEHAAALYGHPFDCGELVRAGEDEDTEASAVAELLGTFLMIWQPGTLFLARDVVQQMPRENDNQSSLASGRPHAFELQEALSEVLGKPFARPTAKSVAKTLQKYAVNRAVWLPDGRHAVLRRSENHEAHSYWVEVSDDPSANGAADPSAATRKPWGTTRGVSRSIIRWFVQSRPHSLVPVPSSSRDFPGRPIHLLRPLRASRGVRTAPWNAPAAASVSVGRAATLTKWLPELLSSAGRRPARSRLASCPCRMVIALPVTRPTRIWRPDARRGAAGRRGVT